MNLKRIQNHSNFSVRLIQKRDLPAVLSLMQLIQPHLNRSINLLNWQYSRIQLRSATVSEVLVLKKTSKGVR